jgi:predicted dehydrogenase
MRVEDKEGSIRPNAVIIGAGQVSMMYLDYLKSRTGPPSPYVNITGCADLYPQAAHMRAREYGITAYPSVNEALDDPKIDIAVILTNADSHSQLALEALKKGVHPYLEKPFASSSIDAAKVLEESKRLGLRAGGAPDTWLGPQIQKAKEVIGRGDIGTPKYGRVSYSDPGPEHWGDEGHNNTPAFYRRGGGPVYDLGPYAFTALRYLLGPIKAVDAVIDTPKEGMFVKGLRKGEKFPIEVPTYASGDLEFDHVKVSFTYIWGIKGTTQPPLEIYGDEASLLFKYTGNYDGPLNIYFTHKGKQTPLDCGGNIGNARGIGLEYFARSLVNGEPSPVDAPLPIEILKVLEAVERAGKSGQRQFLSSSLEPNQLSFIPLKVS